MLFMNKSKRIISILLSAVCVFSCTWTAAAAEEAENIIYVSTRGNVSGDGSIEKPVGSLQDAISLVAGKYKNKKEVTIEMEGGNYNISRGVQITEEILREFNGKLNIRNKAGQEVCVSGAVMLDINDFKPVTDEKIIARLYPEAVNKIGVLDLTKYGYTKETVDLLYGLNSIHENGNVNFMKLYLNGNEESIARYPNDGTVTLKKIIREEDRNSFPAAVTNKSRYHEENVGNGTTAILEFDYPQIRRWKEAKDAFVYGYVWVDYWAETLKVREFNPEEKTIELGNKAMDGIKINRQIHVMNLLEEIDIPGEYYVDPEEVKLYYYPSHRLESSDKVEIINLNDNVINLSGVSNVHISGISFKNSKGNGIEINKCDNVSIDKCKIYNIKGMGIHTVKYTNGTIKNCDVYNIGSVGIYIHESGDKLTLTPGNVTVYNNHLWHVSCETSGGWNGGIRLGDKCVGAKAVNNIIHDSISNPMTYEGNENYIAYNEIYNTLRETADSGVIYSGRNFTLYGIYVEYNYMHDNSNPKASNYGNVGSYMDDWGTGQNFNHNIVHMGKKIHTTAMGTHSKHTTMQYNIAYEAATGLGIGDRSIYVPNVFKEKIFPSYTLTNGGNVNLEPDFWDKGIWKEKYPQIGEIMPQIIRDNGYFLRDGNVVTDNVCVDAPIDMTNPDTFYPYNTFERNVEINDKSIFVDADNHDFRLTMDAVKKYNLSDKIINEENFSMDEIGIQTDERELDASDSEFGLIYPANASKKISKEGLVLKWEPALFADEYTYTIATDKELKNVVKTDTVYDTKVSVEGLQNDTIYYWTVKARQIGKQLHGEWDTKDGVFSFKISKYDNLDKDGLKESIQNLKNLLPSIKEGTEIGEYKAGTIKKIEAEIARGENILAASFGLQSDINETVTQINKMVSGISGYKIHGYQTLKIENEKAFTPQDVTTSAACENGIWSGTLENSNMGVIGYNGEIDNNKVLEYKIKVDKQAKDGWLGMALRQTNPNIDSWNRESSAYLVVVKDNIFELQKYHIGASATGIIQTFPNTGEFKFGEWNSVTFGAVNVEGGVELLLKIGDKVIFNWLDTETPNYQKGSFVITPPGVGATVSAAPADNPTTGEYVSDSSLFEANKSKEETVYTTKEAFYKETGNWKDLEAEGFESKTVRASEGGEAVWEISIPRKINDVYYWHTPVENGDKNASVIFYTQTPQGTMREFEIKVNFSEGTAGWRKMGSFEPLSFQADQGIFGVKITGNGEGVVPISAVKRVISDNEALEFTNAFFNNGKNVMAMQIGNNKIFRHSAETEIEQPPIIENDRTLVPIRVIAEYFGFEVEWNEAERTVILKNPENIVTFTIDSNTYTVNGETKSLDASAVIRNGRIILPLRAVTEGIGKQIFWDELQKIVMIGDELSIDSKTDEEKRKVFDLIGQEFGR